MAEATLEATAYHEAGHAVATWTHRRSPGVVTIRPGTLRSGVEYAGLQITEPAPRDTAPTVPWGCDLTAREQRRLEEQMIELLAGRIAEQGLTGEPGWAAARHDQAAIRRLVARLGLAPHEERELRRRLEAEARLLIGRAWDQVEAVAAALLERETLTAPEIGDLILGKTERAKRAGRAPHTARPAMAGALSVARRSR